MAIYTLPKQYGTGFTNTKVKPNVDVEIDWTNSLTKNLKFYALPSQASVFRNLAATSSSTVVVGSPLPVKNAKGSGVEYGSGTAIQTDVAEVDGDNVTFMFNMASINPLNNNGLFTLSDGTSSNRYVIYAQNNDYTLFNPSGGNIIQFSIASSNAPASNLYHRHIIAMKSGGINWYIDGKLQATSSITYASSIGMDRVCLSSFESASLANATNLGFIECAIWDRVLTASDVLRIEKDAYQILKPKIQPVHFTVDSGVGITLTADTTNQSYSANSAIIDLAGEISVIGLSTSYSYLSADSVIDLTSEITVNGSTTNYNYNSVDSSIDLSGLITITGDSTGYIYNSIDGGIQLQGTIILEVDTTSYTYNTLNGTIILKGPITVNPKNVVRVVRKSNSIRIKRTNNTIRVQ